MCLTAPNYYVCLNVLMNYMHMLTADMKPNETAPTNSYMAIIAGV